MQGFIETLQFTAGSANNIALAQTPAGAGAFSLNGSTVTAGVATLDAARRVILTSLGNDGSRAFTVYGTNRSGATQLETITGGSGTAVQSLFDYKTVTKITTDAATASNVTAGTNAVGSGTWHLVDRNVTPVNVSLAVVLVSGSQTSAIEYTYDDPNGLVPSNSASPPNVFTLLSGIAATSDTALTKPVVAVRSTVSSGTGQSKFYGLQAGLNQGH